MRFYSLFIFFFFFFLYLLSNDRRQVLRKIKLTIERYFSEQDSPFNIAVFRIIFFCYILISFNGKRILWFSHLPSDLQFPPVGMKHFLSVVPITPDIVQKAMILFIVFSFLAMVGCFARAASFFAAICGIYVLGIPEFYGEVAHNNHLIWFMLILSASRCSDVLSIDSIWKAFREADQGRIPRNKNSEEYALPLRFIWLLMGEIYFFPGIFKASLPNVSWAFSDNLKYQLYNQWFERGGWLPFFRIDQHPLLYKMCGLGVIIFELTFIFLVLFPALRYIAAISGILFHNMTRLFMKVGFFDLQICYVSFINWAVIFVKIGKRVFKEPRPVRYEGGSKSYRRKMAVLAKFDIFERITFAGHAQPFQKPSGDQRILKLAGFTLLLINAFFGFRGITSGWPFTSYPNFARIVSGARIDTITSYGVMGNREEVIGLNTLRQSMDYAKFTGMIDSILAVPDEGQKRSKLKTLISVMKAQGIDLRDYSRIRFYKTTYSTRPGQANDPPISRKLLTEIDI
jgi:Vitamin K-dependent gamma-carboxylase